MNGLGTGKYRRNRAVLHGVQNLRPGPVSKTAGRSTTQFISRFFPQEAGTISRIKLRFVKSGETRERKRIVSGADLEPLLHIDMEDEVLTHRPNSGARPSTCPSRARCNSTCCGEPRGKIFWERLAKTSHGTSPPQVDEVRGASQLSRREPWRSGRRRHMISRLLIGFRREVLQRVHQQSD